MTGFVGASLDVQDLVEAQDSLRDADRRKDEFLAALSHELRNPLSAITLSTEVLARAQIKDPQGRNALHIISRQLGQLQRLVDDLLDTARATYDKLVLARHPVELLAVARNVVSTHQQQHGTHRTITVDGEAVWVNADTARLQQMLANLIDNAIKYCPDGARITARGAQVNGKIEIAIEDTGPGIEERHLPRLFERFYRVDPGRSRDMGGTGLGLSIVKHLIETMGGAIGVESTPGRGSTFWFTLPAIVS